MRWQLDYGDSGFGRYVDADEVRDAAHLGREFVKRTGNGTGFIVVFTISYDARFYVRITPVPTFRLVGGPRDGQVCAAPLEVPDRIYFQPVVALDEKGATIEPVPCYQVRELVEVYLHNPIDCPCRGIVARPVEHTYTWPETLYKRIEQHATGVEVDGG